MPPSRTSLDPEGFYARLGLMPAANQESVVAAFRAKARILHPDVPVTGNAAAFVAVKQAYDMLSNHDRREAYDRKARQAAESANEPNPAPAQPTAWRPADPPVRHPRFADLTVADLPVMVWIGIAAFLGLCVFEAANHLLAPSTVMNAGIRPNAATVTPLSPSAQRAVLYGPAPLRLAGTPNFYVVPTGTPALLWHLDPTRKTLVPLGRLPPFSAVQAVRLIRQNGMLEVLVNDKATAFISADHLTAGNAAAAWTAYCGYNAGPAPSDGELLERRGTGRGTLALENRALQPAVVKLRDQAGAVVVSVFLDPGGQVKLDGLPEGVFHPEFAVGELWSRACNMFAAGMRARRMQAAITVPGNTNLVLAPDAGQPAATDISDQAFGRQ